MTDAHPYSLLLLQASAGGGKTQDVGKTHTAAGERHLRPINMQHRVVCKLRVWVLMQHTHHHTHPLKLLVVNSSRFPCSISSAIQRQLSHPVSRNCREKE